MPGRDLRGRALLLEAALALLFLLEARLSLSQQTGAEEDNVNIPILGRKDPELRRSLQQILKLAARKLADPACGQVFSDFTDGAGRRLQEVLEEKQLTGSAYLRWLIVANAIDDSFCANRNILAGTTPGSRIVRVCPQFKKVAAADPEYAATLLIHEELHALGLGENPPSSAEITDRVRARCASATAATPVR
jgi:hypothetical protein